VRVRRAQYQRPDLRLVQPEGELAPDRTTGFSIAAPGDDLDAAQPFRMGVAEEADQGTMGVLHCHPVQIQSADGRQLAGAKTLPCRRIQTSGLVAERKWRDR
jgi:hypothetical protein